jgi:hypothetical protein
LLDGGTQLCPLAKPGRRKNGILSNISGVPLVPINSRLRHQQIRTCISETAIPVKTLILNCLAI